MVLEGRVIPSARSWISLDCDGNGVVLDVDKHSILERTKIHARDLRIIDPLLSYPSTILGRERAIVLNLEHIKAIIMADEVLLREPSDDIVIPVVEELRRRLQLGNVAHGAEAYGDGHHETELVEDESPFEFRVLEVALEAICSSLDASTTELRECAEPILEDLTNKIFSHNLDIVRTLKCSLPRFIARVQKVRDELERLLEDDNDMAELYLSRNMVGESPSLIGPLISNSMPRSPDIDSKVSRASRGTATSFHGNENDVEQLEMLLEAYFGQIDGTLHKLTALREYIDDTEDYINFQLDNHRNQLIQLELFLSAITVGLTFFALVAGVFGMNIPFPWNGDDSEPVYFQSVFNWVVILSGLISGLIIIAVLAYARHKGLIGMLDKKALQGIDFDQ